MSKTFILKRHTSPESIIPPRTPETRTKSLPRDSSVYTNHYHRSEFGLDGSLSRCPVHDNPRSVTTSPRLSQDPSFQLSSKNLAKRLSSIQNWNTIYTSKVPSYQMMESEFSGPSSLKSSKISSGAKHKDLKRKMVFDLHKEVKKGANTTMLEEISDMDRITEICLGTLKTMMESKKYRKYLHHMNNNALLFDMEPCCQTVDNRTNNADSSKANIRRKDSLLGVAPNVNMRAAKRPAENSGTVSVLDNTKLRGPRMSYITIPGMGRILRTKFDEKFDKKRQSVHRDSIGALTPEDSQGRRKSVPLLEKDDNLKALKLMAEIQAQYLKQHEDDHQTKAKQDSKKFIPLLTPEEALACKWLRLSPQQVEALEALIRAKGMDPGIHEHSLLKDYDVFAEIRQLRQAAQSNKAIEIIEETEDETD